MRSEVHMGGGSFTMILDTLNPLTYIRFLKLVFRKKKEIQSVFFIAAHAANIFSILLLRICTPRIRRITHIHDVTAHSGSNNKTIIFLSNYLTAKFSTKVLCYGEFLKNKIHELYKINPDKIVVLAHGTHRENIERIALPRKERVYISLLGRIEDYKGIDVFLKAIPLFLKNGKGPADIKFIIAGKGDFEKYRTLLKAVPQNRIEVLNEQISDALFDEILGKSLVTLLPYHDATQTGTIPLAYLNYCPVICSNAGALPENVVEGRTGFIIPASDVDALALAMGRIYTLDTGAYEAMCEEARAFFIKNLCWDHLGVRYQEILIS